MTVLHWSLHIQTTQTHLQPNPNPPSQPLHAEEEQKEEEGLYMLQPANVHDVKGHAASRCQCHYVNVNEWLHYTIVTTVIVVISTTITTNG